MPSLRLSVQRRDAERDGLRVTHSLGLVSVSRCAVRSCRWVVSSGGPGGGWLRCEKVVLLRFVPTREIGQFVTLSCLSRDSLTTLSDMYYRVQSARFPIILFAWAMALSLSIPPHTGCLILSATTSGHYAPTVISGVLTAARR